MVGKFTWPKDRPGMDSMRLICLEAMQDERAVNAAVMAGQRQGIDRREDK